MYSVAVLALKSEGANFVIPCKYRWLDHFEPSIKLDFQKTEVENAPFNPLSPVKPATVCTLYLYVHCI